MRGRRDKELSRRGRSVVAEAERLLAGGALATFKTGFVRPPGWVLVNALAHCDQSGLARMVAAPEIADRFARRLGFLAAAVGEAATGRSLCELQRHVLVPLELELFDVKAMISVDQVTAQILDALASYRAGGTRK